VPLLIAAPFLLFGFIGDAGHDDGRKPRPRGSHEDPRLRRRERLRGRLGCWQIGGDQWGDVAEADALDVLRASADAGVTFLDTADVYGAGRSEELVGRFLTDRGRDRFFVASKFGRFPRPGWPATSSRRPSANTPRTR
jgi:hypothetical protein